MKPQKALHLYTEMEKKKPKCVGHHYYMFEKYDGWYGYMDLDEGLIRSRAGRVIPSCEHLSRHVKDAFKGIDKGRLIFEILIHDVTEFHELNGILNRTVGDYLALNAFVKCHDLVIDCNEPFYKRYLDLRRALPMETYYVKIAPNLGSSCMPETWQATAQRVWDKGGEGIILKRCNGVYSPDKRNFDLMKIKEEVTLDLLVIGFQNGQGKYEDVVGSLLCKDKNNKAHFVSGMSDEQRVEWNKIPGGIIGKVVEVKAMKVNADGSLREPRFKAIRYDKTVKDID